MIKIVKNPFFRIFGIVLILYYGFFQSDSEKGLNKRLAPDKIKSNISELSNKSIYIIENIRKSKTGNITNIHNKKDKN